MSTEVSNCVLARALKGCIALRTVTWLVDVMCFEALRRPMFKAYVT